MESASTRDGPRNSRASFGRRAAAFVIDSLLVLAIGFVGLAILTVALGPSAAMDLSDPADTRVSVDSSRATANAIVVAASSAGYFVLSWQRAGGTSGQRALGIRVTRWRGRERAATAVNRAGDDPGRLSFLRAAVRWAAMGGPLGIASALALDAPLVFAAISAISFVWLAALVVSTLVTGRGLHDRLSASAVVRQVRE